MQRSSLEATTVKAHNHGVQPGGRTCKSQCLVSINLLQPSACTLSDFSCVQLFATLWSLPGSSVHGILQARILEWVAIPFSRGTWVSGIAGGFFTLLAQVGAQDLSEKERLHLLLSYGNKNGKYSEASCCRCLTLTFWVLKIKRNIS